MAASEHAYANKCTRHTLRNWLNKRCLNKSHTLLSRFFKGFPEQKGIKSQSNYYNNCSCSLAALMSDSYTEKKWKCLPNICSK